MNIDRINNKMQILIESQVMLIDEFYRIHNIDSEELSYLGSGDFGEAYSTGDGRVVKFTNSKTEFDIAKELIGKSKILSSIVEIFDVKMTSKGMTILQEEVTEDSSIEDLFYSLQELLDSQGLPIQYLGHFDVDDYEQEYGEISEEIKDFMNAIENINRDYRYLGIEASDIKPDNMGYDNEGNLKAFDIDDKRR